MAATDARTPSASDQPEHETKKKPCEEGQTPEEDDCLPVDEHLHALWQVLGLDDEDDEEHGEGRQKTEERE